MIMTMYACWNTNKWMPYCSKYVCLYWVLTALLDICSLGIVSPKWVLKFQMRLGDEWKKPIEEGEREGVQVCCSLPILAWLSCSAAQGGRHKGMHWIYEDVKLLWIGRRPAMLLGKLLHPGNSLNGTPSLYIFIFWAKSSCSVQLSCVVLCCVILHISPTTA